MAIVVKAKVYRGGTYIQDVDNRPLHALPNGGIGIVYKRRVYPYQNGKIDLNSIWFDRDQCKMATEEKGTKASNKGEEDLFNAELKRLKDEIKKLEANLFAERRRTDEAEQRFKNSHKDGIYAFTGLTANSPDYLIKKARDVHRMNLHPDKHDPSESHIWTERFKVMEGYFEKIFKERGMNWK